jgi:hypothetical protein
MTQEDSTTIEGKSQTAAPRATAAKKSDEVWIMIPKTKEETRPVFVSFNFVPYQIQRGVKVKVPAGVATALELAIGTTFVPEVDPVTGRTTLTPQETMSYPFQYVTPGPAQAAAAR